VIGRRQNGYDDPSSSRPVRREILEDPVLLGMPGKNPGIVLALLELGSWKSLLDLGVLSL
jgi:hypothetical protein